MAEIRINATGGVKLYDADDSHYAQIIAGTITSNVNAITLGHDVVSIVDNLALTSDSAVLKFGADSEITLTHSADSGLLLKHTATADDKPINLVLQTGETDMAADDVIGKISFQAPDEGTGTDAILVSGAIQAVAEGDHSSSSNATRLEFMTGASEAATAKMKLSSAGDLTVTAGNIVIGTSGKGIDFSATGDAGGMTSELLDDYEEGTWTPTLANAATASFGTQVGSYTKIGQQVTVYLNLGISDLDGGSGDAIISGLPFTASNSPANSWYSGEVGGDDSWDTDLSGTNLTAFIKGAYIPDQITIRKDSGDNMNSMNITEVGTSRILVSISYNTAS
jgi:hypothetical protein